RCVAQTVYERVERVALEVQVGAARGDDVVVQRVGQVRSGAVPGLGEPSGGFDVAEQHIGQGPTVLLAAVGGPQKGGQILVRPGHGEGVSAAEYEDGVGVGPVDRAQHVLLGGGQVQVGAVLGLPTVDHGVITRHDHADIRFRGDPGGLGRAGAEAVDP